jgi:hypothetical protein
MTSGILKIQKEIIQQDLDDFLNARDYEPKDQN